MQKEWHRERVEYLLHKHQSYIDHTASALTGILGLGALYFALLQTWTANPDKYVSAIHSSLYWFIACLLLLLGCGVVYYTKAVDSKKKIEHNYQALQD